jgi:hypothetical protein
MDYSNLSEEEIDSFIKSKSEELEIVIKDFLEDLVCSDAFREYQCRPINRDHLRELTEFTQHRLYNKNESFEKYAGFHVNTDFNTDSNLESINGVITAKISYTNIHTGTTYITVEDVLRSSFDYSMKYYVFSKRFNYEGIDRKLAEETMGILNDGLREVLNSKKFMTFMEKPATIENLRELSVYTQKSLDKKIMKKLKPYGMYIEISFVFDENLSRFNKILGDTFFRISVINTKTGKIYDRILDFWAYYEIN